MRTGQNLLKSKGLYLDWDVCDAVGVVDFQIHFKGRYKMSLILNNSNLMTLVEANKRKGYLNEGYESFLLEVSKVHGILDVMPFYPSSDGNFHKYTQATKLGEAKWRNLNEGRSSTKGAVKSVSIPLKQLSIDSNISEDVIRNADDPYAARQSEDLLVLHGFVNDWVSTLINGDGKDEKAMFGFEYYRNKLGAYCIDGKGTNSGKLTSIYLAELGPNGVNVRYNARTRGDGAGIGLRIKDEGRVWTEKEGEGGLFQFKTSYDLTTGLEVKQDKALVRIANIDPSAEFDAGLFIEAMNILPSSGRNAVAIVPKPIYTQVMKYALNKNNVHITVEEIENFGRLPRILGVPLIEEDSVALDQKKYA